MPAKKSNTGLNRIFRKSTSNKLSVRDWDAPQSADALDIEKNFGVSAKALKEAVAQLSAEEIIRSTVDWSLCPMTPRHLPSEWRNWHQRRPNHNHPCCSEELLNQRAARFGTTVAAPSGASAVVPSVLANDEALSKRAARFGVAAATTTSNPVSAEELTDAMRKRMQRFDKPTATAAAPELQLTEEQKEALSAVPSALRLLRKKHKG